jgi:hypothetical protein
MLFKEGKAGYKFLKYKFIKEIKAEFKNSNLYAVSL